MSETIITVSVTVRVGEETDVSHMVRQISDAPVRHVYTAEAGIEEASSIVLSMLAGAYGDFRHPAVPPAMETPSM